MCSLSKIVGVFCASLLFLSLIYGENYEPVRGVGLFYSRSPGTVAFIPNAMTREEAEGAILFHILPSDGAYTLRRQSQYWFIVNHKTSSDPEVTYLGVEIIPIYPEEISPYAPVFLRRNEGWARPQDPKFNGDKSDQKAFETKKICDFLNLHHEASVLSKMDDDFGFKWHAVAKQSTKNSWETRVLWQPTSGIDSDGFRNRFSPPISQNSKMMINGQLIRFEKTNNLRSNKPVVFGFDGRKPIAAYVRIFSPDSDEFNWEYYLTFR